MNAKRLLNIVVGAILVLSGTGQALGYYNPQAGRWLNRDPIAETDSVNLYAMVNNQPNNGVDYLGHLALPREVPVAAPDNCANACELYKQAQLVWNESWDSGGSIVCCRGVKYLCTWGADNISNPTAQNIARMCIAQHESTHIDDQARCDSCSPYIYRTGYLPTKSLQDDECIAYRASVDCLRNALAVNACGGDDQCEDVIQTRLRSAIGRMRATCNESGTP